MNLLFYIHKKYLLILFSVLALSCSKQNSKLNKVDWSSESGQPLNAVVENAKGDSISNLKFQDGIIEIQNQKIDGFEVSGSYVKKIKNSKGELIRVQALVSEDHLSPFLKTRWNLALKNKKFILNSFLKSVRLHAIDLRDKKIESFDLKLISNGDQLVPHWFLNYYENNGELWELVLTYKMQPISNHRLGTEFEVTPAWVYPKGPKHGDLQQVYLLNLFKGDELMSKSLKVTSADNIKIQVSGQPLQFTVNDTRFDQLQSFYLSQKTLDWFEKTFQVQYSSALDLEIHVGAPDKTNTAFYYNGHVRLGSGDDVIYSKIPWDPSIVTHESSHFIIDMMAHLPFQGEGGSINEAYADYFAATLLDQPVLGEASYLQGPFKRRIDILKKYSEKNGGLYADSLIVSSLLWDLNKKLGTHEGLALAFKTLQNLNPQSQMLNFKDELLKQSRLQLDAEDQLKVSAALTERDWN